MDREEWKPVFLKLFLNQHTSMVLITMLFECSTIADLSETQNFSGQRKYYITSLKNGANYSIPYMLCPELPRDSAAEPVLLRSILVTTTRLHFSLPV